ncbi:aldo/keto reductase [Clostridiales bacterium PH28_bin88]|nr:aldo/keto reductase [Clostridiales bacterium PH28_bin88]
MQYIPLGQTDLVVSRLCFGALTIGPLQANLPLSEGSRVIRRAVELGVNFIDTAEIYGTYPYIRKAMEGIAGPVVIASKSYAYTREGMAQSLEQALVELDRDQIDIFLLHEQESVLTIKGHRPALEYLLEAKAAGIVRAVGISTHSVEAAMAAAEMPEVDVIHPLINRRGIGILKGDLEGMMVAVSRAKANGKGIYAMKAIGGGNLIGEVEEALRFAFDLPPVDAVAVGMKAVAEVEMNVALCEGREIPDLVRDRVSRQHRRLHIEEWCSGCGNCTQRCRYGALAVVEGRLAVDHEKCLLCGYCAGVCPEFCIKVV